MSVGLTWHPEKCQSAFCWICLIAIVFLQAQSQKINTWSDVAFVVWLRLRFVFLRKVNMKVTLLSKELLPCSNSCKVDLCVADKKVLFHLNFRSMWIAPKPLYFSNVKKTKFPSCFNCCIAFAFTTELFLVFRSRVNQFGIVYFTTFFKAGVFIKHEICLSSRFNRGYFIPAADKKRRKLYH